jgi:hypothetical protein
MRSEHTNTIIQFFNANPILQYAAAILAALIITVVIIKLLAPSRYY